MALELALAAAAAPVAAVIIPPAASAEAVAAAAPVAAPAIEATAIAADAPCKSIVVGYIYCYVALVRRRCSRESAYYYLVSRPPHIVLGRKQSQSAGVWSEALTHSQQQQKEEPVSF